MNSTEIFGDAIRRLRTHRKMSQGDLSGRADIGQATIGRLENTTISPSLSTCDKIAAALNVSLIHLLGDAPDYPELRRDDLFQITKTLMTFFQRHKLPIDPGVFAACLGAAYEHVSRNGKEIDEGLVQVIHTAATGNREK